MSRQKGKRVLKATISEELYLYLKDLSLQEEWDYIIEFLIRAGLPDEINWYDWWDSHINFPGYALYTLPEEREKARAGIEAERQKIMDDWEKEMFGTDEESKEDT